MNLASFLFWFNLTFCVIDLVMARVAVAVGQTPVIFLMCACCFAIGTVSNYFQLPKEH